MRMIYKLRKFMYSVYTTFEAILQPILRILPQKNVFYRISVVCVNFILFKKD